MTESVEWERLADHKEAPGDRADLTRRPLCDRISYIADQLEASITGLRGLIGVSRTRVVLAASVATLREVAEIVLEQEVELTETRQQLQSATVLPERWRELMAERDAARRELAEVRGQHQPGPSLHAWRRPDGRDVHGDQKWIRESVRVYGGEHVSMETCLYQGEWKAADDG